MLYECCHEEPRESQFNVTGAQFSGYKFKRKSHIIRPSEIHCKPDPTERNGSVDMWQPEMWMTYQKYVLLNATLKSGVSSNWPSLAFYHWNLPTRKSMCCCILVWEHYWSRNGRNNVLIGIPDLAKWTIENRDKSKSTKHLILPICLRQREPIYIFYKFDKFEIDFCACFEWLVSFLVFYFNTSKTQSDKHNNLFCTCEIA